MALCQGLKSDNSRCQRLAKRNSLNCWQHQNSVKPKPKQSGGVLPLTFSIANLNVLNHNHLNNYTRFQESEEAYTERYIDSINTLMRYVRMHNIIAVSLCEVTPEYYDLFSIINQTEIDNGEIRMNYDNKSLMTVFFDQPTIKIIHVVGAQIMQKPDRDRLQIYRVMGESEGTSFNFTYSNIHGFGKPDVRYTYLYNTINFLKELRKTQSIDHDFLCCGDFNSDLRQVQTVLSQLKTDTHFSRPNLTDVEVYPDPRPTSYHRYVLQTIGYNGEKPIYQFQEKPPESQYSKMDHLLYTDNFQVSEMLIIPDDFETQEHPYEIVNGRQVKGSWISDHSINIYHLIKEN